MLVNVTFTSCKKELQKDEGSDKKGASIEQRMKDFETYSDIIDKIFENGNPTKNMFLAKVAEIEKLESVQKVYVSDSECTVKITEGPAFIYVFNELPSIFEDGEFEKSTNQMLKQNMNTKAGTANCRIAVFNLNSNNKERKNQNALVTNTIEMLEKSGCTVDYFPAEKCNIGRYNDAINGNYNAVYFSAHGAYREDWGYGIIFSNEFVETGIFGQNWNTGMTDEQIHSEMWHSNDSWVMHPASDKWYNNKSNKAYPVGAMKTHDAGAYTGKLFYFASCEALRTKDPNFWNGFSGTIMGWDNKNVVGEAVGAIMFYRMIMEHESLVGFWNNFYGKKDPETNANLLRKGNQNFKFSSTDLDNPHASKSTITQPLNGQYIKTSGNIVAFTIKGTYDINQSVIAQPYLCVTNSKGEELDRVNITAKDGKFSKTFFFYEAFGVINFKPYIVSTDIFPRTVSLVFSGKFNENFAVEPEEEDGVPDIIPPEILDEIIGLGLEIHGGTTPPNIEGTYLISPAILVKSNFNDNAYPGSQFANQYLTFSKQNNSDLSIRVDYIEGSSQATGLGAFISGEGNKFTVYVPTVNTDEHGHICEVIEACSGEIEEGGIRNFYNVLIMKDDHGDPDNDLIENGQGRLFKDGDGFSERTTKGKAALAFKNKLSSKISNILNEK